MLLSDLLSYVRLCREASELPPGTAASVFPLILGVDELDEMVDGTELTVGQWLEAASRGISWLPKGIDFPTA